MVWRLISYSEIQVPLPPFQPGYTVALVQDENKRRLIVQVEINETKSSKNLVGVTGEVKCVELPEGKINVFVPNL